MGFARYAPYCPLATKMLKHDVGAIPIGENDRLVGMVTDRDIAIRGLANGRDISKLTARDVMTKPVIWCWDSDNAMNAARLMENKKNPATTGHRRQQENGRDAQPGGYLSCRFRPHRSGSDQGGLGAPRLNEIIAQGSL